MAGAVTNATPTRYGHAATAYASGAAQWVWRAHAVWRGAEMLCSGKVGKHSVKNGMRR